MPQKDYIVYVEQKARGYVAYCPGLGCKAHGWTEKEAMQNLQIEISAFESQTQERKSKQKKRR
ncbi:MAG: hypothetical protein FJ218_10820 [Ignavibacteria bacterium]|nr:hypothetical protein [Ignavibacteria bacterium]